MKKVDLYDIMEAEPSLEDLWNTCMSFRHDFGLLSQQEQKDMEFQAGQWLRAWRSTFRHKGEHPHAES